ncbi:MAG: hypothetical protein P8L85_06305 [Rubripirellula sp.]|nr:hypothetical protein [Rubripirellula sp.]
MIDGFEKLEPGVNLEDGGLNSALKVEFNDGDGTKSEASLGGSPVDSAGGRTSISGSVGGCADEKADTQRVSIREATSAQRLQFIPELKNAPEFTGACRGKGGHPEILPAAVRVFGRWAIFSISREKIGGRRLVSSSEGQTMRRDHPALLFSTRSLQTVQIDSPVG